MLCRTIRCDHLLLRFRLLTLFIVVFTCAVLSFVLRDWLDRRPIQWAPYSPEIFSPHADSDRPVVILIGADWDPGSIAVACTVFEDRELKRLMHKRNAIAYYADLTFSSPEVIALLRRLNCHTTPTVAIYPSGILRDAIVIDGLPTAAKIVDRLKVTRHD